MFIHKAFSSIVLCFLCIAVFSQPRIIFNDTFESMESIEGWEEFLECFECCGNNCISRRCDGFFCIAGNYERKFENKSTDDLDCLPNISDRSESCIEISNDNTYAYLVGIKRRIVIPENIGDLTLSFIVKAGSINDSQGRAFTNAYIRIDDATPGSNRGVLISETLVNENREESSWRCWARNIISELSGAKEIDLIFYMRDAWLTSFNKRMWIDEVQLVSQTSIVYVDNDASGLGNGISWPNAFNSLQDALIEANAGTNIWVAEGTYLPSNSIDRQRAFVIPDGVKVLGGFSGIETLEQQRNWDLHPTYLSGDIGTLNEREDNSVSIVRFENVNSETLLDGFSIIEANGILIPGEGLIDGVVYYSSENDEFSGPTIRNCIFERNIGVSLKLRAEEEGRINLTLANCLFQNNLNTCIEYSTRTRSSDNSNFQVNNCTFRRNQGPCINVSIGSSSINPVVEINNSKFFENEQMCITTTTSMDQGLGDDLPSVIIRNSDFSRNERYIIGNSVGLRSRLRTSIFNCVFAHNGPEGMMIFNAGNPGGSRGLELFISNCTFYRNKLNHLQEDAIIKNIGIPINCEVANSIFWTNRPFITFDKFGEEFEITVTNSAFMNNSSCDEFNSRYDTNVECLQGNFFDVEPLFVNPENGDLTLSTSSPLIDKGTNQFDVDGDGPFGSIETSQIDLVGNSRIVDGDTDGVDIIDIGAIETQESTSNMISVVKDSGEGSLRALVLESPQGAIIKFSKQLNRKAIIISSPILIGKDIILQGNGPNNTIIKSESGQPFIIRSGKLQVSNLSLVKESKK